MNGVVTKETTYGGVSLGTNYQKSVDNALGRSGVENEYESGKCWHKYFDAFFEVSKKDESKFYLISALANGVWEQDGTLTENGVALTISSGWYDNTYMIMGDANRRFAVPGTEATGEVNYYSNCTEAVDAFVTNENSTDFVFEKVEDELVNFNVSFKKGQKYATMYLPFAVSAKNDVTAYYSTLDNIDKENKVISLELFENVIPARTAVVLYREDATTAAVNTFTYTTAQADALSSDNIFKGYLQQTAVDATGLKCYLLLTNGTKEAFYWVYAEYTLLARW
jgi:hypothetical protein